MCAGFDRTLHYSIDDKAVRYCTKRKLLLTMGDYSYQLIVYSNFLNEKWKEMGNGRE